VKGESELRGRTAGDRAATRRWSCPGDTASFSSPFPTSQNFRTTLASTLAATGVTLSPEAQLLLCTAAAVPDDHAIRRLVAAGMDWPRLSALTQHERAAPIVLRHLRRLDPDAPDTTVGDLRRLATVAVMQLLQLERLLHEALDRLAEQQIEVMLLKGAGLAYSAYASFADRPMGDLDLLVRPAQAEAAWSLLQHHGWTWPATRWASERFTAHQHLPPLLQGAGGEFRLEIHGDLLAAGHPFRLDTADLWARARHVPHDGRVLLVPQALDQLWYVCVHFAWSHEMQWGAWRAVRDVAAIVAHGDIAWSEFVDLARESRAGTACYWTLRLTNRLLGNVVPAVVLARLRPPGAEWWLQRVERHFVANLFPSSDACPSLLLARRLWAGGIRPGWSGHGRARPWQVSERWGAGADPPAPTPRLSLWTRLRKVGSWVAYLRRINRFTSLGPA
jgi:putative nucleotidyltransferase-like protein